MAEINRDKEASLNAARLRELVSYDPATGKMTWLKTRGGNLAGCEVGSPQNGYRYVTIRPYRFSVHRLAWLYVHGEWPAKHIDHINGDRSDNRLCNLREATHAQNIANRSTMTARRFKGTTLHRGRWMAQIREGGKNVFLGYYDTESEAAAVYAARAKAIYGDFAKI